MIKLKHIKYKTGNVQFLVEGQYTHSVPIQTSYLGKNGSKKQQYMPPQLILDTWPSTSRDIYKINDNYNH